MAKAQPFWESPLTSITRSPAKKPACKDLGRNGQSPATF
ncbi:Malolactic regulator [Lacticaseibacillus chiayiensis]|nr:Malolactic regulator [Lacticaseibacillus chiayiensis]